MTIPYPVPPAHDEPLASVTRVLALAEGDGVDRFQGGSLPQLSQGASTGARSSDRD